MTPLISLAAILILGIGAQWCAWAIRLPSIILLLAIGLILGPVTHLLDPKEVFGPLLLPFTSLAVGIILFEGGLSLRYKDVKSVGLSIISLVTIGMFVGFTTVAAFLHYYLDYTVGFSLLQSAILTVTGPTVIIPMLNHLRIKEPISSVLHWEGIVIDPIGAILAVLIFEGLVIHTANHQIDLILYDVVSTLTVGITLGFIGGFAIWKILKRFWIPDQLQNPVVLMLVLLFFTISNSLQMESGLITVTGMGIFLANQTTVQVRHIIDFKESLRVILISVLFILLASTVNLNDLISIWDEGLLLLLFVVIVARPLAVFISTLFSKFTFKERAFIASLAPRGIIAAAISSLFSLQLLEAGYSEAGEIAPLTFSIIAGTVLVYGIGSPMLAKAFDMIRPREQGVLIIGANPLAREIGKAISSEGFKVHMIDSNYWRFADTKLRQLPVQYGTIFCVDEDDQTLQGIGKMLALTDSDNVNSLAVLHFAEKFEKANLFQLPNHPSISVPTHLRGRMLFSKEISYEKLLEKVNSGWVTKSTNITEEFDMDDWNEEYQDDAIPLFFISKKGALEPITIENPPSPPTGGKIIFLAKI